MSCSGQPGHEVYSLRLGAGAWRLFALAIILETITLLHQSVKDCDKKSHSDRNMSPRVVSELSYDKYRTTIGLGSGWYSDSASCLGRLK